MQQQRTSQRQTAQAFTAWCNPLGHQRARSARRAADSPAIRRLSCPRHSSHPSLCPNAFIFVFLNSFLFGSKKIKICKVFDRCFERPMKGYACEQLRLLGPRAVVQAADNEDEGH
jgi:hypothetical protein